MATPEGREFELILREADGTERPLTWESVTGEAPAVEADITVDGETWHVVEERGDAYVCVRGGEDA